MPPSWETGAGSWELFRLKQTQGRQKDFSLNQKHINSPSASPYLFVVAQGQSQWQKAVKGLEEGGWEGKAQSCLAWWQSHFNSSRRGW